MDWYEDDFYNEPSEFDMQVEEFKASLLKSVKEEFISEMEHLRKENEELQDVKKNFKAIKQDFDRKKSDLEYEYQKLKKNVRRDRLVDLMEDHKVILYKAHSKRELPPKCDKCDENGRIYYTTPLGKEAYESCPCREGKAVYYPKEYQRYEFRFNRDKTSLTAWYRQYSDDEDGLVYDNSIYVDNIFKSGMKYEDMSEYRTFFKTEEECQAYCDYLNKNEE